MKAWIVSFAAMIASSAALAADPGVTDTEILIGDVNIMSGPAAFVGKGFSLGSKIAAAEINAAGGVNGRMIRVITEDDGYVPARSFQALTKLIENDHIFALNGTSGTANVMAMMPLIVENNLPTMVTEAPASTGLQSGAALRIHLRRQLFRCVLWSAQIHPRSQSGEGRRLGSVPSGRRLRQGGRGRLRSRRERVRRQGRAACSLQERHVEFLRGNGADERRERLRHRQRRHFRGRGQHTLRGAQARNGYPVRGCLERRHPGVGAPARSGRLQLSGRRLCLACRPRERQVQNDGEVLCER